MPEISRFEEMTVHVWPNDHPPPHVHVRFAGRRAMVVLSPLRWMGRDLPAAKMSLMLRWAAQHVPELVQAFNAAQAHLPVARIAPPG